MQVFSSKIEGGKESVISTPLFLSNQTVMENEMTTKNLTNNPNKNKPCSIEGCLNGGRLKKEMCEKHYQRFKKHGSPYYEAIKVGNGDTFEEKFWSRVKKDANEKGCWEWQGKVSRRPKTKELQYGRVGRDGINYAVHRMAWELTYHVAPQLNLLHSCDNTICVNPEHLREGTQKENAEDRIKRNRQWRGAQFPQAKLTDEKVREIRNLRTEGLSYLKIANVFNVSESTIREILAGIRWRHVV
jgi:hypothetical protein